MMQGSKVVLGNSKQFFIQRITSVLFIFFIAATTQAQSLIPELSFKDPVLKTGKGCTGDGLDGAVYIFQNAGWGMDAIVTILGRSSAEVRLTAADIKGPEEDSLRGTGYDDAWQPAIQYGEGSAGAHLNWWMEFKISFVRHDDNKTSVSVNQFFVTGLDIDGDGQELHEYQSYYRTHSFTLQNESAVYTSSVRGSETDPMLKGQRFDGTKHEYKGISVSAEDAMVNNFYKSSSSLIVRLGAETGNIRSVETNRMYALLFKSLAFDIPVKKKIPVNLIASVKSSR